MALLKYLQEYMSGSEDGEIYSQDESDVADGEPVAPSLRLPRRLFTVHLSTSLTAVNPFRVVLFDVIDVNTESVYNAVTGRFKANETGLYVFLVTLSAEKNLDTENESVCLIQNFHPVDKSKQSCALVENGNFKTKTLRYLIRVEKGDEIWVMRLREGVTQDRGHVNYITWSGGLLERFSDTSNVTH